MHSFAPFSKLKFCSKIAQFSPNFLKNSLRYRCFSAEKSRLNYDISGLLYPKSNSGLPFLVTYNVLACVDIACTSTIARCLIMVAFSEKCAETWVMTNGKPASVEASTYYVLLLLKSNVSRCSESKYSLQVPSNMPRPAFRVDCERSG